MSLRKNVLIKHLNYRSNKQKCGNCRFFITPAKSVDACTVFNQPDAPAPIGNIPVEKESVCDAWQPKVPKL